MEFEEIRAFLDSTTDQLESSWNINILSKIANQRVPDFVMGGRGSLLRSDIHILWTKWFIESIVDPNKLDESNYNYADVVKEVNSRIPLIFIDITNQQRRLLARYISRLLDKEFQRRQIRKRISLSLEDKKLLWDIAGSEPRCWICGYKFTEWAKNKFLGYPNNQNVSLPLFIDYITLHGLKERHISVEIDHIVPFSEGGQENFDNFRLACGWCNSHKSNRLSLYDVNIKPRMVNHPKLYKQSVPHPFWIVRLLSVRKCCEHEGYCDKTIENSQLTVIFKHPNGSMNPTNLKVICSNHDPLGSNRLIHRDIVEQIHG